MKKHHMPDMKEGGVNVTPLIDIIMCLIVFFMLVTKVGVRGVDKDIQLPDAIYGAKISNLAGTLTLNVHNNGPTKPPQVTTLVDSERRDLPIFIQATNTRPLRAVLIEFKKTHPDKAQVILRGDAEMDYGALEMILTELSAAQITDTAYETTRPKTGQTH